MSAATVNHSRQTYRSSCPLAITVLALSGCVLQSAAAQPAGPCTPDSLLTAQARFDLGLFHDVITGLTPCLTEGFDREEDDGSAHRLVYLSHYFLGRPDSTRYWFRHLMYEDPGYDVQRDDPLFIHNLAQEFRLERRKVLRRRWLLIGGAAAAAVGSGVYLLWSNGDRPRPLPGPGDVFPPPGIVPR